MTLSPPSSSWAPRCPTSRRWAAPDWGRRTAGSVTVSPSTTPPTRRSTPTRGSSTSSAKFPGSCATTACPTGPRAPARTWARSCCSTARCSTTPVSRSASAPSTGRSPRPTTTPSTSRPTANTIVARASVGVATRLDPFTYRDAAVVAQRLHTITSRRPRLAFDADLVGALRARMVSIQPRIMSSATEVLDRVVGAVSDVHSRRRSTLRK